MGIGLRNVVNECHTKKITLGGKTYGSLNETTIMKLINYYYHTAIISKAHTDVPTILIAVFATLNHCASTDKEPRHFKCPNGADS